MIIRALSRREPWMTQPEWRHALRHRRALLRDLEARGIPVTPVLALRMQDFLVLMTLTRRMELAFFTPANDDMPPPVPTLTQLEDITTARERLAKLAAEIFVDSATCTEPETAAPEECTPPSEDDLGALLFCPEILEPVHATQPPSPGPALNRQQRRALARKAA